MIFRLFSISIKLKLIISSPKIYSFTRLHTHYTQKLSIFSPLKKYTQTEVHVSFDVDATHAILYLVHVLREQMWDDHCDTVDPIISKIIVVYYCKYCNLIGYLYSKSIRVHYSDDGRIRFSL